MGFKMYEPLKILSDGDKIVIIADGQSYALEGAIVTSFNFKVDRPMMDVSMFGDDTRQVVSGLAETRIDISLRGGMMSMTEDKNVFDQKKMAKYTQQINQEVKAIALKRALDF